jgi:hypothetical protein
VVIGGLKMVKTICMQPYTLRELIQSFMKNNPTYYGCISIYHFFNKEKAFCEMGKIKEISSIKYYKYQDKPVKYFKIGYSDLKVWI